MWERTYVQFVPDDQQECLQCGKPLGNDAPDESPYEEGVVESTVYGNAVADERVFCSDVCADRFTDEQVARTLRQ